MMMVDNIMTTKTTLENATLVLPVQETPTLVATTTILKPVGMEKSISNASKLPKTILARMFSQVYIGHFRFLVMDCPTASTLEDYIKVFCY
jgi:hypothetical protein